MSHPRTKELTCTAPYHRHDTRGHAVEVHKQAAVPMSLVDGFYSEHPPYSPEWGNQFYNDHFGVASRSGREGAVAVQFELVGQAQTNPDHGDGLLNDALASAVGGESASNAPKWQEFASRLLNSFSGDPGVTLEVGKGGKKVGDTTAVIAANTADTTADIAAAAADTTADIAVAAADATVPPPTSDYSLPSLPESAPPPGPTAPPPEPGPAADATVPPPTLPRNAGVLRYEVYPSGLFDSSVLSSVDAVVHQTSCVTARPAGFAATLTRHLPYGCIHAHRLQGGARGHAGWAVPGSVTVCYSDVIQDAITSPAVISLNAQFGPGTPSKGNSYQPGPTSDSAIHRLRWFAESLEALASLPEPPGVIAIPHGIGCGLAGGKWKLYKAALVEFAARHPAISVRVVQRTDDFIERMRARSGKASRRARAEIASWKDPLQRALGLSIADCFDSMLTDCPTNDTKGPSGVDDFAVHKAIHEAVAATAEPLQEPQRGADEADVEGAFALLCSHLPIDQMEQVCAAAARRTVTPNSGSAATAAKAAVGTKASKSEQAPLLNRFRAAVGETLASRQRQLDKDNDMIDEAYRDSLWTLRREGTLSEETIMQSFAAIGSLRDAASSHSEDGPEAIRTALKAGVKLKKPCPGLSHLGSSSSAVQSIGSSDKPSSGSVLPPTSSSPPPRWSAPLPPPQPGRATAVDNEASANLATSVSSQDGCRIPARLVSDAYLLSSDGQRHAIVNNIWDSGSALTLMGASDFQFFEKLGCVHKAKRYPSSISRVHGIGASNLVLYHATFTAELGGAQIRFLDVPVLANHSGLLFGNDVLYQFQQNLDLRKGLPDSDGYVVLRDDDLHPISRQIPISVTRSDKVAMAASAGVEAVTDAETADFLAGRLSSSTAPTGGPVASSKLDLDIVRPIAYASARFGSPR